MLYLPVLPVVAWLQDTTFSLVTSKRTLCIVQVCCLLTLS